MDNKKYLNKVLDHMVRGTEIDYDQEKIYFPFSTSLTLSTPYLRFSPFFSLIFLPSPIAFSSYCKNQFGLTEDEIRYVWKIYKDIIKDKISKREP